MTEAFSSQTLYKAFVAMDGVLESPFFYSHMRYTQGGTYTAYNLYADKLGLPLRSSGNVVWWGDTWLDRDNLHLFDEQEIDISGFHCFVSRADAELYADELFKATRKDGEEKKPLLSSDIRPFPPGWGMCVLEVTVDLKDLIAAGTEKGKPSAIFLKMTLKDDDVAKALIR